MKLSMLKPLFMKPIKYFSKSKLNTMEMPLYAVPKQMKIYQKAVQVWEFANFSMIPHPVDNMEQCVTLSEELVLF